MIFVWFPHMAHFKEWVSAGLILMTICSSVFLSSRGFGPSWKCGRLFIRELQYASAIWVKWLTRKKLQRISNNLSSPLWLLNIRWSLGILASELLLVANAGVVPNSNPTFSEFFCLCHTKHRSSGNLEYSRMIAGSCVSVLSHTTVLCYPKLLYQWRSALDVQF